MTLRKFWNLGNIQTNDLEFRKMLLKKHSLPFQRNAWAKCEAGSKWPAKALWKTLQYRNLL